MATIGASEADLDKLKDIQDAPLLHPTEEQWAQPIEYLNQARNVAKQNRHAIGGAYKITRCSFGALTQVSREHAAHVGIVRIQPPASWRPPFAHRERDWERFVFRPRVQPVPVVHSSALGTARVNFARSPQYKPVCLTLFVPPSHVFQEPLHA